MNKKPFILLIMMLVLIPSGCVKNTYDLNKLSKKAQYSPTLSVIAAQGDISLRDIVKPSDTVRYDADKFVRIVFRKDSVINFKLTDYLNFNNMVTFAKGYKVGILKLDDFQSSLTVKLGTISSFFSAPLKAQFNALNGTTNNFPAFPQTDIGETTFSAPSNFQNAVFASGTLTLSVKNNLTAPLSSVKITLYNTVVHTIIGSQVTIPAVNAGATQTASIDLTGKTLTNSIVAAIVLTGSAGTSTPVLIDLNSSVQVTMSATNLTVQSGRVKLPIQSMNASDTVSMLDFNPGTGIEIEKLRVLTGNISYTLISRSGVTGSLTFSFPTSPVISKTIAINGNSTVSGTISLNNTDADLSTDPTQKFNRIPGKYLITLNSSGNFIDFNKNDSVHIDVSMQNPNFDYVKGYFGQQNQLVAPDVLSTGIEDILKNITGQFHVTSPSIRLNYSNSFGVPIQVTLNATGKKNTSTVNLGLAPFSILSPTSLAVRDVSSIFTIDKTNSSLADLVSLPPSEIDFSGSAKMNPAGPNGLRDNYVFGNSRILGSLEVEVPLDFWINNMQFPDTVNNFLKPDKNSDTTFNFENMDLLQVNIVANNGFPMGASLKMMLYDSIKKVVIKTVDATNFINPAPVDVNGKATGKTESTTSIDLSKDFFTAIKSANKIIFSFSLNTTGNGSQSVRIYSDYSISFKASVVAKPRLNL
jgi:hypothetical protein